MFCLGVLVWSLTLFVLCVCLCKFFQRFIRYQPNVCIVQLKIINLLTVTLKLKHKKAICWKAKITT
jgi:hypothetical protein